MSIARLCEWVLVALVILGAVPMLVGSVQLLLVGLHRYRSHLDKVQDYTPRVAVLVPAWNEAAVLALTVDRLMLLDYPRDRLRVYVVDDASTDNTTEVLDAKRAEYPGMLFHLRRDKGGQGKAHTLNHGLAVVLGDEWTQAVLIMDADVVFTALSLRRMARHLADPEVGAVTAYIKEGSEHQNGIRKAISFEYAVSQAGARRAQNVVGAVACLAGGAQLHSRENLESINGAIDTSTLAEDTVTTLLTQLEGRRVIFEPNAIVWAEEPETIDGLWRQRLRWARGNVQVTRKFEKIWFRKNKSHGLGGLLFGLLWFTTLMLPIFMIASSLALVILWLVGSDLAFHAFDGLWILNGLSFVFLIVLTLLVDPAIARRTWRRAVMFPGLISVTIVLATCFPAVFRWIGDTLGDAGLSFNHIGERIVLLALYLWVALCMLAAYGLVKLERAGAKRLAAVLLWFVGYGPLLCAITLTAYVKEARGADQVWEKTLKTGQVSVR